MKDRKLEEILNAVTCRVLEQTAFMFPEPADMADGFAFGECDMMNATVKFNGDKEGTLSLIIPAELCQELSANMLGEDIDEADSDEKEMDAAREAVNMIAGQLLTELYGETAVFNLQPPETARLSSEEFFEAIEKKDYACSMADDHPIVTIFSLGKEKHEHQSTGS